MKRPFRIPTTLRVVALAAAVGCGEDTTAADAAVPADATAARDATPVLADAAAPHDAGVSADASGVFDTGCKVFEAYDPVTMMCEPVA